MRRPPFTTWSTLPPAPVNPWPLCLEPWRWTELDAWASEVETIEFLKALVVLLKPRIIVETGTYQGQASGCMALGCRENGIGHIWTFDTNPDACEYSTRFMEVEELSQWVTITQADARTVPWDKPIDLLFIDGGEDRIAELDHFTPYLTPRAVVVIHNAHDERDFYHWDKLSTEWNMVMIACPCGLFIMTKKA